MNLIKRHAHYFLDFQSTRVTKMKLILGIDPDVTKIPNIYQNNQTPDIFLWGKDIIDASLPLISGVKFQLAYFELLGLHGLSELAKLIKFTKSKSLSVIIDAKRGDIGSTSNAYAKAYLEDQNDYGPNIFSGDFLTVNPLMGEDCLDPFVNVALKHKKGLFILLETSNPGANMILKDKLKTTGNQVNEKIANYIKNVNQSLNIKPDELSPIGCVIGATNANVKKWREMLPNCLFLMPGIGAQGGDWKSVKAALTKKNDGVWIPISRGITDPGTRDISKDQFLKRIGSNTSQFFEIMKQQLS